MSTSKLQSNIDQIHQRMAEACQRAGRDPSEVKLVAVTKYAEPDVVQAIANTSVALLGESRPQRLWELATEISGDFEWHLIGHLQRNKVAKTLPLVSLLHSVDSGRLLTAINQEATKQGLRARCLLEVNISGDENKHGWAAEELPAALEFAASCESVDVLGLMTMAARIGGIDRAAADFEKMRVLRDSLLKNCPERIRLDELSMGMSGDFEAAIEHGATLVRVGSALFEGV